MLNDDVIPRGSVEELLSEALDIIEDLDKYGSFYGSAIELDDHPIDGNWRKSDGRLFKERIDAFLWNSRRFRSEKK